MSRQAVVIGGSIGGLCAARVLSDHFDRIIVVDRDSFPEEAAHRKGVPQSRHPHALLDGGRRELERLFPGFDAAMLEGGAVEVNPGMEMARMQPAGWSPRRNSHSTLLFCSRILIESVIRKLVAPLGSIEFVEDTEVTRLLVDEPEKGVVGVAARRRSTGEQTEVRADLVVDASGSETKAPEWLAALGLSPPEKTVIDANAGYSTRWYELADPDKWPADWWWKVIWINPVRDPSRPEEQYVGLLFPVENSRWVVTTASWGGRELPRDGESFERIVSKLRSPILSEALALAEPISPVYARRSMQNFWRHYERWTDELRGFIAVADAVCAFNPVYGQGMTSAARCAGVLQSRLEAEAPETPGFEKRFFAAQGDFLEIPWTMATSADRQQVRTVEAESSSGEAPPSLASRIGAFTMRQFTQAAARDRVLERALFDVINLSRHPRSLMREPGLLGRVLFARLRQLVTRTRVPGEVNSERPPAAA